MKRLTDFETPLAGSISGKVITDIVESILNYPEDFEQLYMLIKSSDNKVSWRSIWACEKLCDIMPELFMDKREELIKLILNINHDGKKRLILTILHKLPLKDVFDVDLLNACMEWMFSPKESIAVQARSITLTHKLCEYEPELLPELRLYLENAQLEYLSAGVRSTVKNTLKKLNKKR